MSKKRKTQQKTGFMVGVDEKRGGPIKTNGDDHRIAEGLMEKKNLFTKPTQVKKTPRDV